MNFGVFMLGIFFMISVLINYKKVEKPREPLTQKDYAYEILICFIIIILGAIF